MAACKHTNRFIHKHRQHLLGTAFTHALDEDAGKGKKLKIGSKWAPHFLIFLVFFSLPLSHASCETGAAFGRRDNLAVEPRERKRNPWVG